MEADDIVAVVDGFGDAAAMATASGLDGVEVNAGQYSLVRQFLSGLTNHRGDEWGTDRLRFARDVLAAARRGVGSGGVLGLRLSCDELAPWAGLVPDAGSGGGGPAGAARRLPRRRPRLDLHAPPRPGPTCTTARRSTSSCAGPSGRRSPDGFRSALQGSVVDVGQAEAALADGVCDLVEMTRAQIADPDLASKVAAGRPETDPAMHPLQPDAVRCGTPATRS